MVHLSDEKICLVKKSKLKIGVQVNIHNDIFQI